MAKLKESLTESDFQKLRSFMDEVKDKPGIKLMTGKGRRSAILGFGSRATKGSYPLWLESGAVKLRDLSRTSNPSSSTG